MINVDSLPFSFPRQISDMCGGCFVCHVKSSKYRFRYCVPLGLQLVATLGKGHSLKRRLGKVYSHDLHAL